MSTTKELLELAQSAEARNSTSNSTTDMPKMKSKIEVGKKYKTRDGRDARVYATDGGGKYCVHGAIKNSDAWHDCVWTGDGQFEANGRLPESDIIFDDIASLRSECRQYREALTETLTSIRDLAHRSSDIAPWHWNSLCERITRGLAYDHNE